MASNFGAAMPALEAGFVAETGHRLRIAYGSTGRHYAQIVSGAPFDAFLAADAERPALLERDGRALPGTRMTYALGRLVLWSSRPGFVDGEGAVLERGGFRRLSIANPALAPYGAAAREVLVTRGLWEALQPRLVRGENIAQAHQFVASGNAELGFVARAQLGDRPAGSSWLVPETAHAPIEQQAVLLRDTPAARALLDWLGQDTARAIIVAHGYGAP